MDPRKLDYVPLPLAHRPTECPFEPPAEMDGGITRESYEAAVRFCFGEHSCRAMCPRRRPCLASLGKPKESRL